MVGLSISFTSPFKGTRSYLNRVPCSAKNRLSFSCANDILQLKISFTNSDIKVLVRVFQTCSFKVIQFINTSYQVDLVLYS